MYFAYAALVIITDCSGDGGNQRVQVFDNKQGSKFLYTFGQNKFLHNFISLALNSTEDKLFITDGGSSVKVFTSQGQFYIH